MANDSDCKVCYVPHDEEIHEATLRIRHWLNTELTRKLGTGHDPALDLAHELLEPELAPQSA